MEKLTVDDVLALRPCVELNGNCYIVGGYTRERVTELFADRKLITLLDVWKMPISIADKIWMTRRVLPLCQQQEIAYVLKSGFLSISDATIDYLEGLENEDLKA